MKGRRTFSGLSVIILLVGAVLFFDLVVVSADVSFTLNDIRTNLSGVVPGIDNVLIFPRGDLYTATRLCELLTFGLGNESIPSGFPSDSFGNMPVINNTAGLCANNSLVYWDKGTSSWTNGAICSTGQPFSYILDLSCRVNVSGEVSPLDTLTPGDFQIFSTDEIKTYYSNNSPIKLFNGSENFAVTVTSATKICEDVSGGGFPYLHYMIGRGFVNCAFNFSYYMNVNGTSWESVGDVCDYSEVGGEYSFIENGLLTCARTPSACIPDCSGRVCGPDPNCGVSCEAEGFTCEASGSFCDAAGQCIECDPENVCAVGVCTSGICVYNYWADMNGVKFPDGGDIGIYDFVRMVSNSVSNFLITRNGLNISETPKNYLDVNYYFAKIEGESYVEGDPYNYNFSSNSGWSENIIRVSGDYDDSPLSAELLSPSCGDYFDAGSEQTIEVYINDSDDIVTGNITVDGVFVRDIDNFVDNVVTFNHTFSKAGNSRIVVEVSNIKGESFKVSVNVMVVDTSKTDYYVAACIDEPGSLDRVFNASSVFFNASSSVGLKYNLSDDSYTIIPKEKLVFTWKFTFGTGREGDSCVGLGLNGHCPGTNAPIYAFHRLFPTVNNNRVFLSVSISPSEIE